MDVKNASAAATAAPPELAAIVSSEVARQLDAFKQDLQGSLDEIRERTVDNRATIVVFSGDLDKVLAGFVIATGAAAAGLETSMFFTFWGLAALKKKGAAGGPKNVMEKMFGMMTPSSSESLGTSKMNFFGMGAVMLRKMMKDKEIASLEELMQLARELDVKMIACTMSMDAMGVGKQELFDGIEYGGVAYYMGDAASSRVTLFI
jgi:peroxiredoxin family protein